MKASKVFGRLNFRLAGVPDPRALVIPPSDAADDYMWRSCEELMTEPKSQEATCQITRLLRPCLMKARRCLGYSVFRNLNPQHNL